MTTPEQLRQRLEKWAAFNRWEDQHLQPQRPPQQILADLGTIWNWLPPEVRSTDPDPEKTNIRNLRAALAKLKPHI
jgi:hypothetical protein